MTAKLYSICKHLTIWICKLIVVSIWHIAAITSTASAAGALNVGVQLEPPNLDPTSGAAAAIDEIVYANIFEGLTRLNENGEVIPALAHSWTISDDGLIYEFSLHENVRFHDGTPFTADDVAFTLDRARARDSTNAQHTIFEKIKNVEAIAPHKVRITLSEPMGAFTTYLGWGDAVIVSAASASANASHPIGTGPFRFQRWRKGASVSLVRNQHYWGNNTPLDQINFIFIPDPTAAFAALMAGDVDGFPNYPAAENLSLIERDGRFKIIFGTGEGEIIVAINNAKAPFDDLRVRRAINHAIDKHAVIAAALFGYGAPIGSHFPPHHPAYVDLSNRYPYDPGLARQLLTEAGYKDGFALTLSLPPPAYARRSGEVVAAQLETIGIHVEIRNIEWAQWLDQVFANKSFDLTIVSHTEPLDIDIYARDDYYFQYKNPTFDTITRDLRTENDPARRHVLFKQAQEIIANDAVNIFLASSPKIAVWSKDATGIWANAPLQANDFTNADMIGRKAVLNADHPSRSIPAIPILLILIFGIFAITAFTIRARPVFLATRVLSMGLSLVIATVVIFILLEIAPGDPASFMMGLNADPASIEAVRVELGLDQPALARYFNWVGGLVRGDFGVSYTYRVPVGDLIAERIWISLPLALIAFAISTAIGIPAGLAAAAKQNKLRGRMITSLAQAGVAIPNFWLAILLVMIFAVTLRWFSAGGFPGWDTPIPAMKALILPAIALALPQAAILTQIMRSSMLNTLDDDYIRTARAKGLSYNQVLRRHALRNALIPTLTILGLQFSFLIAGGIIIENVFYLPGLGRLVFQSIVQRDLIVVKSIVIVLVFTVIIVAFFVDLTYAIADPRLRNRSAR